MVVFDLLESPSGSLIGGRSYSGAWLYSDRLRLDRFPEVGEVQFGWRTSGLVQSSWFKVDDTIEVQVVLELVPKLVAAGWKKPDDVLGALPACSCFAVACG